MNRRDFLKITGASSFALYMAARNRSLLKALAVPAAPGLSEPALQPKFVNAVPNAADPAFSFKGNNKYDIEVGTTVQQTGLVDG
jgi:hypothetical protein